MDLIHLKDFIVDVVPDIDLEDVTEDSLLSDMGLDSLDLAQVIFTVENELGIEIDPDQLDGISTVGDAIRVIEEAQD